MPPTAEDRLLDILEAVADVEGLLKSCDLDRFKSDKMLRLASERCLEIVCEAAQKLPEHIKREEPSIDWRKMVNFANLLRHAYHDTDVAIVWDIIHNDLPPLKFFVERRIAASGN